MYILTLVVFSIITNLVCGLGNGAPQKSCKTMSPGHSDLGNIPPLIHRQNGQSIYTFNATWDKNLKMARVSVSGEPVAGFLIQGRLSENGPAVGTFVNIIGNPDAKYQDCTSFIEFGSNSSVTHTHSSDKQNLVFFWQPPKDMMKTDNVTFYGTLARSKEVFWVKEKSNSLNLGALEDDIPVTKTSTTVVKSTTGKVISMTTPTSKGSNTTSFGISLLTIWLIITIKISMP